MFNIFNILSIGYEKVLLLLPLPQIKPQLSEPEIIPSYQFTYKSRPDDAIPVKKRFKEITKQNNAIRGAGKKGK